MCEKKRGLQIFDCHNLYKMLEFVWIKYYNRHNLNVKSEKIKSKIIEDFNNVNKN